jgi:hypothetical protein
VRRVTTWSPPPSIFEMMAALTLLPLPSFPPPPPPKDRTAAAIASELAAATYKLDILDRSIEDCPSNFTR